ncbi:UNVERIFIED_CONTAM: hypothetical protein Sradi_4407100 [Sesamum radiatum]|uniref:CCHC-type domain-containing protein n=1 Tax=Sesamum radiatum TaxID=300843 RepID=A0AAW2NSC6_SESRA
MRGDVHGAHLKIKTLLGGEHLVSFTYERLPNFCYLCGRLGHIGKYCEVTFAEGFVDPGDDTPYRLWIRAPLSRPIQSRIETSERSDGKMLRQKASGSIGVRTFLGDFCMLKSRVKLKGTRV